MLSGQFSMQMKYKHIRRFPNVHQPNFMSVINDL
jgi:hypothetical protein